MKCIQSNFSAIRFDGLNGAGNIKYSYVVL